MVLHCLVNTCTSGNKYVLKNFFQIKELEKEYRRKG